MRPRRITWQLATSDDDGVCASQTPGGAGNLTINGALATGGVATLTSASCTQRRVLISTGADETARTFTVYGTRAADSKSSGPVDIQEAVTGVNNSTVETLQDFATVTRVAVDGATAGAIKVGTSGRASTPWYETQLDMPAPFAITARSPMPSTTPR
jgi:hypothetical protein